MRVLVIECGGPAVRKYRMHNAMREIEAKDPTVEFITLNWSDMFMNSNAIEVTAKRENAAKELVWLAEWVTKNAYDIDVVWSNDHREDMVTLALILQGEGAKLIADVDDLFTDIPSGNVSSIAWNQRKKRAYRELLEKADVVVGSTPYLAKEFNGQCSANFMVPSEWEGPQREKDFVMIACPAGSGRAEDYAEIEGPLRAALALPQVKVLFCGWMPDWAFLNYPPGKVICSQWVSLERYPDIMRWLSPDIVVSPLLRNNFNCAKSNLKWMEAAMMGAAFLGEDFGEYQRTVEHGVTGLLADGDTAWRAHLEELCSDPKLRTDLIAASRKEVMANWVWKEDRNVLNFDRRSALTTV